MVDRAGFIIRVNVLAHVPKVRILPGPPKGWYHFMMKKKVYVEKKKFDAVLAALLNTKPIARKDIKTSGKRGPKTAMFPAPSKS